MSVSLLPLRLLLQSTLRKMPSTNVSKEQHNDDLLLDSRYYTYSKYNKVHISELHLCLNKL